MFVLAPFIVVPICADFSLHTVISSLEFKNYSHVLRAHQAIWMFELHFMHLSVLYIVHSAHQLNEAINLAIVDCSNQADKKEHMNSFSHTNSISDSFLHYSVSFGMKQSAKNFN